MDFDLNVLYLLRRFKERALRLRYCKVHQLQIGQINREAPTYVPENRYN